MSRRAVTSAGLPVLDLVTGGSMPESWQLDRSAATSRVMPPGTWCWWA